MEEQGRASGEDLSSSPGGGGRDRRGGQKKAAPSLWTHRRARALGGLGRDRGARGGVDHLHLGGLRVGCVVGWRRGRRRGGGRERGRTVSTEHFRGDGGSATRALSGPSVLATRVTWRPAPGSEREIRAEWDQEREGQGRKSETEQPWCSLSPPALILSPLRPAVPGQIAATAGVAGSEAPGTSRFRSPKRQ